MITFDAIGLSLQRNRIGGVGTYVKELVKRAATSLPDIEVLVHDAGITSDILACLPTQVVYRPPRWLERYRSLRNLPGGLVHSTYYRTSRQRGVRSVITVYDFIYEKFDTGVRRAVHARQKRDAVRRADAVICISANTRHDLLELYPDCSPDKVFVTHLAASEHFVPLERPETRDHAKPFVLFVGGRQGHKNFPAAVEAVKLAGEFDLVCVGGGPFTTPELAIGEKALPGRLLHAGQLDTAALNRLYNAAVCLLYPSLYEGFGIPIVEAMTAGCPFVALNRSSIPEVAGNAGVLVDEADPHALASAIAACAIRDQRMELIERGFAQAERFSWDKTFAATSSVYRAVLPGIPS